MSAADGIRSDRVRGPAVWLNMDQRELDDAYDQAVYAPNREQVMRRWAVSSAQTRLVLGMPRREQYGPSEAEMLDIYPSE